jgi:ApaG protein
MSVLDNSIRVEVKTEYIEQQSSPEDQKYLFSYTITIINLGEQTANSKPVTGSLPTRTAK